MSHTTSGAPRQASLRSPLGRVRGAGSAKSGTHHWWMQRVTSIALLPLTIWFIVALATNAGMTHGEAMLWIGRPLHAVLLLALIGYVSTSRRIPVVVIAFVLPILAVLHTGKTAMRIQHWGSNAQQATVSELPEFFEAWIQYGLSPPLDEEEQSSSLAGRLFERASLFQMLWSSLLTV